MQKLAFSIITFLIVLSSFNLKGERRNSFQTVAPQYGWEQQLRLKTNFIPWIAVVPNLGAEYVFARKWSVAVDIWYSPWKISDKYSVKAAAVLPEGRFWFKDNSKGSFINLHFNVAWYNVRYDRYRYQDRGRPLLGAGIGYGYRLDLNPKWGLEFEIGAGVSTTKYDRFYNIDNGALKDSRETTYWGLDRLAIALTYNLSDL